MKYLFIVAHPKHFIGGAEVQAYRIATQLKSKNIDIEYLMSWHKNEDAIYDENNIKINYFKRGGITKIFSTINAYRKIKEIKPDVIYMRGAPYAWAAGVYYSKQKSNVTTLWQCPSGRSLIKFSNLKELIKTSSLFSILFNLYESLLLDLIQQYTIKHSDKIISQTTNNLEYLMTHYDRHSVKILKGIDLKNIIAEKKYDQKINVYFIRNIKPRSRVDLFLKVAEKILLSSHKENFEFHIIGQNQCNYDFSTVNPAIKYHGKVENKVVNQHLASAHILIDTLFELNELTTYSTTFIEAWANKTVILSFDTNPDHVLNEMNIGFKVESIEDCCSKLIDFDNDRNKLKEYSMRSYEYACNNHDINNEVEQIINYVNDEKKN